MDSNQIHNLEKYQRFFFFFFWEYVEKEKIEIEHVPGNKQKADILTKALGIIKFREMRDIHWYGRFGENGFQT